MAKAAFLDRDGVVIQSQLHEGVPVAVRTESQVVVINGVVESIEILRSNGFIPIVITNQPDVARGFVSLGEVDRINRRISQETGIEHFFVCPHDDFDECLCRKPKSGLIDLAVKAFDLELSSSFLVGDRWRDIDLGNLVGMKSYLVDYSYMEKEPNPPYVRVASLLEAVKNFIEEYECKNV
jgi:D-glycero-D-manno-heptose 1,7-bisphosphate phosphatase